MCNCGREIKFREHNFSDPHMKATTDPNRKIVDWKMPADIAERRLSGKRDAPPPPSFLDSAPPDTASSWPVFLLSYEIGQSLSGTMSSLMNCMVILDPHHVWSIYTSL